MSGRAGERFDRLVDIMRTLRSPDGCPWDREQTQASLRPFVLEEAYEVLEAIEHGSPGQLCEELGDFLFEAVFLAQIADEHGEFSIADAIDTRVAGGRWPDNRSETTRSKEASSNGRASASATTADGRRSSGSADQRAPARSIISSETSTPVTRNPPAASEIARRPVPTGMSTMEAGGSIPARRMSARMRPCSRRSTNRPFRLANRSAS